MIELSGEKDEKVEGLTFIVGPAVKLLSKEEHLSKRQHADAIAEKLADGIDLARHYLDGSKVVHQFGQMTYDPFVDMVIEFARPGYKSVDFTKSVQETTNARVLYMTFKRVRHLTKNAPVTNEKIMTSVVFRGISCTLTKLLENTVFTEYSPHAYRCMVYGEVIENFLEWWILQLEPSVALDILDKKMKRDAYKKLYSAIPTAACKIIHEYESLMNDTLIKHQVEETSNETPAEKRRKTVNQLTMQLEHLTAAILTEWLQCLQKKKN